MHIHTLLSFALASLAIALPTGEEQGKKELVARYQQVGKTQRDIPGVGYNLDQQPIYITGGCVSMYAPGTEFWLATGYRLRVYRDKNCRDRIGGQEGQAGQSDHLFQTYEFNSYTAWKG